MNANLLPGKVWKHKRTGNTYRIVCEASIEKTLAPVVVYCRASLFPPRGEHECWVRPRDEFLDGRFEHIKLTVQDGKETQNA